MTAAIRTAANPDNFAGENRLHALASGEITPKRMPFARNSINSQFENFPRKFVKSSRGAGFNSYFAYSGKLRPLVSTASRNREYLDFPTIQKNSRFPADYSSYELQKYFAIDPRLRKFAFNESALERSKTADAEPERGPLRFRVRNWRQPGR